MSLSYRLNVPACAADVREARTANEIAVEASDASSQAVRNTVRESR